MKINNILVVSAAILTIAGGLIFFNSTRDAAKTKSSPAVYPTAIEEDTRPESSLIPKNQYIDKGPINNADNSPDNKSDEVIQELIAKIGIRAIPLEDSPSLGQLAKRSKTDRFDPVGELFPHAGKLVEIGPQAIIPVAKYWASLKDPSSDDYISSLRTLKTLVKKKEDIYVLYTNLAKNAENHRAKMSYEVAAARFAPAAAE